ncbi:PilN domain-containing protein [Shewanella mesophila]|uniref:PilN domain-containing protein n=1 Tax=Shewanella mesophila TaxID=2864208 RepID=UPI001C65DF3F|nr:PilN domain-containing protein [Shewanella mesophila]QYJ86500.1 PilN domain-containing protein [Shewanella mesophila]
MTPKLRVNLFNQSLLPPKLRVSFVKLTQLTLGLVVLLLIANLISYLSVADLTQQKSTLLQQKTSYDQQKSQLEIDIAARAASPALVAEVDLMAQQLEVKRRLLGELGNVQALTSRGYSSLLTDLARVADSSIWLRRIHVIEDQFEFEGYSRAPLNVPQWVERLKQVDTLKGQAFSTLTMSRGEGEPLSFILRSRVVEESTQ